MKSTSIIQYKAAILDHLSINVKVCRETTRPEYDAKNNNNNNNDKSTRSISADLVCR